MPVHSPSLSRASHDAPVIAIGGSAGAIDALRPLLGGLPANLQAVVLVVVHQPGHVPSGLQAVLQAAGPLPVSVAIDGEQPRPGRIYVATPDHHLVLQHGALRLTSAPRECHVRPAVDVLFRSVALDCGRRAAGVVLSGALDDGTAGLWAIKDHGGAAYVQDPAEARHPWMPRSAIEHVAAVGVHTAEILAGELAAWTVRMVLPEHRVPAAATTHETLDRQCPPWSTLHALQEQHTVLAWMEARLRGHGQAPTAADVAQAVDDLHVLQSQARRRTARA